jgi:AAA domain
MNDFARFRERAERFAESGATEEPAPDFKALFAAIEDTADLVSVTFDPLVEIIEGLIVPGLTLFVGKPKKGKSFAAYDWGLAIAGGGCALGALRCTKFDVLYLALEDSRRRLKDRAVTLTAPGAVPRGCKVITQWPRGADGVAALVAYLDANPACRVVIIDVYKRFKGKADDGSVYDADYASLEPLQALATQRDVAIVVLHHTRKADADDMIDLASGTLGLTGAADHIIALRSASNDKPATLEVTGRDLPNMSWDMEFDCGRWRVLGPTEKPGTKQDEQRQRDVRIRFLHGEGDTIRKIAEIVGCSRGTVERALKCGN